MNGEEPVIDGPTPDQPAAAEPDLRFVLVDDAFGAPKLPATELLELFGTSFANAGGDVAALLERLPNKPATVAAIDSQDHAALVGLSLTDETIRNALTESGALPEQAKDKAHKLKELLENRFGAANVKTRADLANVADIDEGSIVFLDYRLETDIAVGQQEAVNHAIEVAKKLATSGKRVPFVVLMSEQAVQENDVAEFCKRAQILRGSFEFIRKADLIDDWRLAYMTEALKVALPEIRSLRDLLVGLDKHVEPAAQSVMADLRAIAISEWAACRAASLQGEGQRFSDYVLWLFCERLVADLEGWKNASKEYDDLDQFLNERAALRVTALSLASPPRTNALIRAYSHASFLPADKLRELRIGAKAQLGFGDVLGQETALNTVGAKVRAVVTPECDLFDRPKRDPDGNEVVLMVEGTVRSIDSLQADTNTQARQTKSFLRKTSQSDDVMVVDWDTRRVFTAPHNSFDADPHPEGLRLLGRLRQTFASELRDDVLRTLARTGVMIRPPYLGEEGVSLHARGEAKEKIDAGAVVVRARERDYAALTRKGVEAIRIAAEKVASKATGDQNAPETKAAKLAEALLKAPGALSQLHNLAVLKDNSYKDTAAPAVVSEAVQLRYGSPNTNKKTAKPLQAVIAEKEAQPEDGEQGEE